MDSIKRMPSGAAKSIAKTIVGAVEKEKSRVAALGGSGYDVGASSDLVEFNQIERSPSKRFLSSLIGNGQERGGWSAHASLRGDEVTEMTSVIANAPDAPTQLKELKYSEDSKVKVYTQSNQESYLDESGAGGVLRRSTVVTVDKSTGALFIEMQ